MSRTDEIEAILGPPKGVRRDFEAQTDTPSRSVVPISRAGGVSAMVGGGVGGGYESASRISKELASWMTPLNSADGDILPDKTILDARARDSLRNDAYVQSGGNIHKDNIVGSLFRLNSKPENKVLGLDDTWAREFQEEVESKFTLWAESENNWPDAARYNTLTGLVRLSVGIYVAAGEVLASVEWLRDGPRPYSTAIQMIDLDRLSTPWDQMDNLNVRGGIERNQYGAPQAYHVRMAHPTDFNNADSYLWERVKIRKPWGRMQMIHIIEQTRPDQTRGIAEIVAGLKELRITKKFRDIVLQNAIVNATYAATIESEVDTDAIFSRIGGGDMSSAIETWLQSYFGMINTYAGASKNLHIDGVKIPHLFPGTKLNLRPAGSGGPLGSDFENSLLRYTAANLGVSYEQLSRDYSRTNYSSIRAAMTETWKFMQARKRMVADRFASHVYRLWLEEALNTNDITSMPRNAPNYYEKLNNEAYSACEWIGSSRGQIDELKETQAAVLRIRYNLSTYEEELGRLGSDWRKKFQQIAREKKIMGELEIAPVFGPDNQMNASSGVGHGGQTQGGQNAGQNNQPPGK